VAAEGCSEFLNPAIEQTTLVNDDTGAAAVDRFRRKLPEVPDATSKAADTVKLCGTMLTHEARGNAAGKVSSELLLKEEKLKPEMRMLLNGEMTSIANETVKTTF
jgi:hypothetical protein